MSPFQSWVAEPLLSRFLLHQPSLLPTNVGLPPVDYLNSLQQVAGKKEEFEKVTKNHVFSDSATNKQEYVQLRFVNTFPSIPAERSPSQTSTFFHGVRKSAVYSSSSAVSPRLPTSPAHKGRHSVRFFYTAPKCCTVHCPASNKLAPHHMTQLYPAGKK